MNRERLIPRGNYHGVSKKFRLSCWDIIASLAAGRA
jgi:hypothetical protein